MTAHRYSIVMPSAKWIVMQSARWILMPMANLKATFFFLGEHNPSPFNNKLLPLHFNHAHKPADAMRQLSWLCQCSYLNCFHMLRNDKVIFFVLFTGLHLREPIGYQAQSLLHVL